MTTVRSLCVFCGSSPGADPVHGDAARTLGAALAGAGIELVYGGGRVGLMGMVADAAMAAGGKVTGVIPKALADLEVAHHGLDELHIVGSMHERKALMADRSNGFIALSGGIGTFEELFEIWTWAQLGYHRKPVALYNIDSFYDPLIALLRHTVDEGFMRPAYFDALCVESEPVALIERLRRYQPPARDKWAPDAAK